MTTVGSIWVSCQELQIMFKCIEKGTIGQETHSICFFGVVSVGTVTSIEVQTSPSFDIFSDAEWPVCDIFIIPPFIHPCIQPSITNHCNVHTHLRVLAVALGFVVDQLCEKIIRGWYHWHMPPSTSYTHFCTHSLTTSLTHIHSLIPSLLLHTTFFRNYGT